MMALLAVAGAARPLSTLLSRLGRLARPAHGPGVPRFQEQPAGGSSARVLALFSHLLPSQ